MLLQTEYWQTAYYKHSPVNVLNALLVASAAALPFSFPSRFSQCVHTWCWLVWFQNPLHSQQQWATIDSWSCRQQHCLAAMLPCASDPLAQTASQAPTRADRVQSGCCGKANRLSVRLQQRQLSLLVRLLQWQTWASQGAANRLQARRLQRETGSSQAAGTDP